MSNEVLDVRVLVPTQRHELILRKFRELPRGESFTFTNDHDPKPLYYECRSIFGDVVGWEYLARGGKEWTVRVTRTEESQARELSGVSTLMDLRKTAPSDWKHVIFHRYGMMTIGQVMEILAAEDPDEIHGLFEEKFAGQHTWTYRKRGPDEYVIHLEKLAGQGLDTGGAALVDEFDVRPHPPAKRHEMVFGAFDRLKSGEAFVFTNDHDPKPLYYQIEAESGVPFAWEYLEAGPEVWRVRVAKR